MLQSSVQVVHERSQDSYGIGQVLVVVDPQHIVLVVVINLLAVDMTDVV